MVAALTPRAETILKSIVSRYIAQAVPVPSQAIASDPELRVSSATVRNEMARLECDGYIIRAHCSAGSIPSDKGYRYYVESLKDVSIAESEQRMISHLFHQVERALETWLSLAATLLAQQVHNVAVVTTPKSADCRLKHVELVSLQESLALAVVVLHGARVRQQLLKFDRSVPQSELTVVSNKLNAEFADLNRHQIAAKHVALSPLERQIIDLVQVIQKIEDEQEYEEPYLEGWHYMLHQPEFIHSEKMRALLELAEQRGLLQAMLPKGLKSDKVQVVIGRENREDSLHDFSIIISKYGIPEEAVGTLGVLGPTRMPYAQAISMVSYLSTILSELMAGLYRKETPIK